MNSIVLMGLMVLTLVIRRTKIAALVVSGLLASEGVAYLPFDVISQGIMATAIYIALVLGCALYWKEEGNNIGGWMSLMTLIATLLAFLKLVVVGAVSDYVVHNQLQSTIEDLLMGVTLCIISLLLLLPAKPWTLHEQLADFKRSIARIGHIFGHQGSNGRET